MKKTVLWLLILSLCFGLASCNLNIGTGGNNGGNGGNGNANGDKPIVTHYVNAEQFYSSMQPEEVKSVNFPLQSSFRDDNYWYYVYYLGRVDDIPLDTSTSGWMQYSGNMGAQLKSTRTVMTNEEVAKAVERSHSQTNAWSEELITKVDAKLSLSKTVMKQFSLSAAISAFGASVGAGASSGNSKTISGSISVGFEKIIGFTREEENTLTQLDEVKKGKTYTETQESVYIFDPAYTPVGFYKYLSFVMVDVFGIVMYDPATKNACVSTVSEYAGSYSGWAYSANKYFEESLSPEKLSLDVDNLTFEEPERYVTDASEEVITPEMTTTTVTVDFTEQYLEGEDTVPVDLNKVTFINYDSNNFSNGVLKLKGVYNNQRVTKYILKGCYNTQNKDGDTSKYILSNLTIQIDAESDIEIVLENISFKGVAGLPAIQLNSSKKQNITVTLTVNGESIVYGSNGTNATSAGANGTDGADAIDFSASQNAKFIIAGAGKLTVKGGDGGNGKDGSNGTAASKYQGSGTAGQSGGNGGNGGDALCVTTVDILSPKTVLLGGNGGNGGKGGNGGNGVTHEGKGPTNIHDTPGNGGNGANGGNGGNGGNTGLSYDLANGSRGGNGGAGGAAGIGGKAGCFWWDPWIGANQYWYGNAGAAGSVGTNGTNGT